MDDSASSPVVEVSLCKNFVALIDAESAERVIPHKWCVRNGYASRACKKSDPGYVRGRLQHIVMHREILSCPEGMERDHINGNKLDNRKANLRCATRSQNAANRPIQTNNTSGYRGVSWSRGRWRAAIGVLGRKKHLGRFDDPAEAARAYDRAALEVFGEFAALNFPEGR